MKEGGWISRTKSQIGDLGQMHQADYRANTGFLSNTNRHTVNIE